MSDPAIQVENLSKRYYIGAAPQLGRGGLATVVDLFAAPLRRVRSLLSTQLPEFADDSIWALRDISFQVESGEILGIIGHNGAGKSTLLKVLTGITRPTQGKARIYGRVSSLLEVGTGFHPELTGRENVYLNGAILGMRRCEIEQRFDMIVDFADISQFIDTPVKRYSSGMKVRLAFAVAAHLEPEILLIDEVLAVGDAAFQRKSLSKMQDVTRSTRTVLFVSHQLDMVRAICNRVILMENGRIQQIGSADEVINAYLSKLAEQGDLTQFAVQERLDMPVQLRSGRLLNAQGMPQSLFDVFDPVTLEIEYEVHEPVEGAVITIDMLRNGATLFLSFDTDENPERLQQREQGLYRAQATIPAGLLKPGHYAVTLVTGIANAQKLHRIDEALRFEIHLISHPASVLSYSEKRRGVIAMPLQWQTTRL